MSSPDHSTAPSFLKLPKDDQEITDVDPDTNVSPRNTGFLSDTQLPATKGLVEPVPPEEEPSSSRTSFGSPKPPKDVVEFDYAFQPKPSQNSQEDVSGEQRGRFVDPASGQSSVQTYLDRISTLEGELKHYQLRVAGVGALATMLSDKTDEVEQWKDKAERLEIALDRQEHKSYKLEQEVRELREKCGEDSSRRSAPTLQPSRQILNAIMKENAQLKIALNRLVGNGNTGYKEGLKMSELHEVIQEQNRQIQRMYSHLRMLKEGVTMSQNLSGVTVDSGLESVSTVHSSSAPSSMSNVSSEMMMLRNEVHSLERKLEKRDSFIETLSSKLSQLQKSPDASADNQNSQQETATADKRNMADIEQKLKIMAKEIEDKETAVREVSAQLEKVHAEFADKQKECQGLEKKLVDSCYPKLQQLEQDNAFLKAMTQRQDKENRKMLEQLKEAEKKLESSSGDSGSDHAELNKLRSDKSRLLADLEDLKLKYDVSSADFQKFEMLRDELEGTKEGLRRLKQEKRIIADRLQSAEQNNEALLQQYKKTQQMFQQEFKARAGLTGITGMVSRERGLILPNESHAYGNPFMISVQDGLKNTEAHDDTGGSYGQRQLYNQGGHLQNASFMYNQVAARTTQTTEAPHSQSYQQQPQMQQLQSQYAGQSSYYSVTGSYPQHDQPQRQGSGQSRLHMSDPGGRMVSHHQPRVVGTTQGQSGYYQTPHLVTSESSTVPMQSSGHPGRAFLMPQGNPPHTSQYVAEPRDNSGNSEKPAHYRTTTNNNNR